MNTWKQLIAKIQSRTLIHEPDTFVKTSLQILMAEVRHDCVTQCRQLVQLPPAMDSINWHCIGQLAQALEIRTLGQIFVQPKTVEVLEQRQVSLSRGNGRNRWSSTGRGISLKQVDSSQGRGLVAESSERTCFFTQPKASLAIDARLIDGTTGAVKSPAGRVRQPNVHFARVYHELPLVLGYCRNVIGENGRAALRQRRHSG
jgi:hypothetical protein